jgi:hypothetical protein
MGPMLASLAAEAGSVFGLDAGARIGAVVLLTGFLGFLATIEDSICLGMLAASLVMSLSSAALRLPRTVIIRR